LVIALFSLCDARMECMSREGRKLGEQAWQKMMEREQAESAAHSLLTVCGESGDCFC